MTQQSLEAAPPKLPLPVIVAIVWLSYCALIVGFAGTLSAVLLGTHPGSRHITLAMFYTNPKMRSSLFPMCFMLALAVSGTVADLMKRRMTPRYRPVLPASAKRRGRRNFAVLLLFYAVLYGSMIGRITLGKIDWTGLIVCLALLLIGWQGAMRFAEMLPKAPPLAVDPLTPSPEDHPDPEARSITPALKSSAAAAYASAGTSGKRSDDGKRAPGRLWLNEQNSRMLVSERPRALRMLGRGMALFMLAGAFYLAWIPTQFRHPAPFFFYLMPFLALFCCVMLLSEASPQRLEIDLVGRTYRYSDYRPITQGRQFGATVLRWPFVTETLSGIVSEDFQGVGVRVFYGKATTYYVNLIWNDPNRSPITLGMSSYEDKAPLLMEEAAEKLSLPALGRILPK